MVATLLAPAPKTERVNRYPKHTFNILNIPFHIQPMMIAPVLPGETLSNMYFEARCVTDPIKSPIIGWKKEYYFFYVRITDLLSDAIRDMFVDPANVDLTATMGRGAYSRNLYSAKGGMDYVQKCLERVTVEYFRDEDETWNKYTGWDGLPMCQIRDTYWMDSLTDKDLMPQGANISAATTAGDLDRLLDAFEQLRALGVANMTYEDFLRSYGIAVPSKDENKPELLARFSDFQYPSNTVDPTTGSPSSAVSWVFKNGARDPKLFKEPGFIFGVSITRPKVYFGGLAGNAASFMSRAWDWMPSYLAAMPETSLKRFAKDTGPLGLRVADTDDYWLDMRDVLLYGDQWFSAKSVSEDNFHDGAFNLLGLPDVNLNVKNPSLEMSKVFFKVNNAESHYVREDGVVSLTIAGAQVDHTVGNLASA